MPQMFPINWFIMLNMIYIILLIISMNIYFSSNNVFKNNFFLNNKNIIWMW